MKAWMSSNFSNFATELRSYCIRDIVLVFVFRKFVTELRPLIDVRIWFLAHLSQRLIGELIVYPWSGVRHRLPSVSRQ